MTSCGYFIVDLCIISFSLNCIMQLKQFYYIATKVSSRKKHYYFWWSTWLMMWPYRLYQCWHWDKPGLKLLGEPTTAGKTLRSLTSKQKSCNTHCFIISQFQILACHHDMLQLRFLYHQLQRSWKGGILVSHCPSVHPSVSASVRLWTE